MLPEDIDHIRDDINTALAALQTAKKVADEYLRRPLCTVRLKFHKNDTGDVLAEEVTHDTAGAIKDAIDVLIEALPQPIPAPLDTAFVEIEKGVAYS